MMCSELQRRQKSLASFSSYNPDLINVYFVLFIADPAKRMNGAYGYIGYFGVIILSISVALQLLGFL